MKKILTIILVITLLFSFGCMKRETDGSSTSTAGKGIAAYFEEGSPPDEAPSGYEIDLELKVVNTGQVELGPGEIKAKLKGEAAADIFEPSLTSETSNDESLLSAELGPTYIKIDMGTISYAYGKEMIEAEETFDIKSEICFPYLTKVQASEFWVSDEDTDLSKGKISGKDNSEAPVQVSSLTENAVKDKLLFSFVVSNVGKGEVVDSCFPEEKENEEVKITISQPRGVSCEEFDGSNSGTVKLMNGKRKVNCEMDGIEGIEGYKNPLIMELEYNYDLDILKKIKIVKRA